MKSNQPAERASLELEKTFGTFSMQPWSDFTRRFAKFKAFHMSLATGSQENTLVYSSPKRITGW